MFASALRGYDRSQVDERLAELVERCRAEGMRADGAEADLRAALNRVRELQEAAGSGAGAEGGGFGVRVERVLKLAEREAAELRAKATDEATALVEKARAEAEQHRHEAEQALIARATSLDQEAARRTAALDARERDIAEKVDTAREEAETIRHDAERDAAAERAKTEQRAIRLIRQAEETASQHRDAATREVERLTATQEVVRTELARLHHLLDGEIGQIAANGSSTAPEPASEASSDGVEPDRKRPSPSERPRSASAADG